MLVIGLRLCNIYCCHGDGSDGRHVCSGHMHHYQATMLVICLRLSFCCCHGDGSDGRHVCSSIMAICTNIRLLPYSAKCFSWIVHFKLFAEAILAVTKSPFFAAENRGRDPASF